MSIEQLEKTPIAPLCSFQLSGTLPKLLIANTVDDLRTLKKQYKNTFILGKGSNTLINPNHNYDAVIKLSPKITEITVSDHTLIIPASTSVNKLMTLSQTHGLSGLEFSAGVPASIGGMVTMNFGCWGNEIAERVQSITVVTPNGELETISGNDCAFSYRSSRVLKENWAILDVTLKLIPDTSEQIKKNIQTAIQDRLQKQPLREATFGSIFKNPHPHFAAALIEATGLKGHKFDTIQVSTKHANFLENCGHASYQETIAAIQWIQSKVLRRQGIQLIPEVQDMKRL